MKGGPWPHEMIPVNRWGNSPLKTHSVPIILHLNKSVITSIPSICESGSHPSKFYLQPVSPSNKMTNTPMTTMLPLSSSQLTKKQTEILEAEFIINSRPDITTRDRLSRTLKLSNLLIHVWFQTRRLSLRHSPTPKVACQTRKDNIPVQLPMSISNKTTGKRKSPCDVYDYDWTSPPYKKSAIISPSMSVSSLSPQSYSDCRPSRLSMTSLSYHPSGCDAIQHRASRDFSSGAIKHKTSRDILSGAIQHSASRDTPSGATSSPMSVDFLSRSSCITPVCGMPMFYPPADFQCVTYSIVH
ncbi:uncharacterized protein LOC586893 [Strongylocentrotus purpuratus]|uniref:Homeobox domain-containing protein n=1 Tax=Strongylocentrotus purpuratus TaxID=7668 RepID=A0A7M7TH46_STRPU|nr:uncharacterized protein LOC586893 [Strongylocentrotus purpuratus]